MGLLRVQRQKVERSDPVMQLNWKFIHSADLLRAGLVFFADSADKEFSYYYFAHNNVRQFAFA